MLAADLAKALGATKNASGWKARCPAHDDHNPSLSIREGDTGAALVTCHAGCERGAVIDALKARGQWNSSGATNGTHEPRKPARPVPIVPVPRDALPCDWRHPKHGRPSATWNYYTAEGELHHVRARFDFRSDDGASAKEVLPVSWCRMANGKTAWASKEPRGHLPLYNLVELLERPNAPVLIVEGEKAADAAAKLLRGYVVITSASGSKASAKTDWRPVDARRVIIWPDNDPPGADYAKAVAKQCNAIGAASVAMVTVPLGLPLGWDIADEVPARIVLDPAALVAAATPWQAKAEPTEDAEDDADLPPQAEETLILNPSAPLESARAFLKTRHTHAGIKALHHHRGAFYGWLGGRYSERSENTIRAEIYDFLDRAKVHSGKSEKPFTPTSRKVSDVLDAFRAIANLPDDIESPAWIGAGDRSSAVEFVCCANGLLHLPTLQLRAPSPTFFSVNGVDFAYDAKAQALQWSTFISTLWPDDSDSISALQEIIGYLLTPDTKQQKAFMLIGPKRSGRGTIARIIKKLLGGGNVCAPTIASLSETFGMAQLIGRTLAIIGDARVGTRTDASVIAERILTVTGEDAQTVNRKYNDAWNGTLKSRFLIISNELPRLSDASGALASRFIVLVLKESFFGREDIGLEERLTRELPGIFNWAVEGWQRLTARGYFIQPAASREVIEQLEDLGSPISAFLRDRCERHAAAEVNKDHLFDAWKAWCTEQGRDNPGTMAWFGRDLRAAMPHVSIAQVGPRESRVRVFRGLRLK